MVIDKKKLGDKIRKSRISRGYSQMDISNIISSITSGTMDVSTISDWETGTTLPTLENFTCLCIIFDWENTSILTDSKSEIDLPTTSGDFNRRLKYLVRISPYKTLNALASELHVDPSTISKWTKRGRIPDKDIQAKLLSLLGCSEQDLFGD